VGIGRGPRHGARFGEGHAPSLPDPEEEAGDPAATTARCPEPQERKARTSPGWLAASYFSGWNFCVAHPQVFDNQISSLLPLTLTR
jgi:hypothetical protein